MVGFPPLIYTLNIIPIKILEGFPKLTLVFVQRTEDSKLAKSIYKKKNKKWGLSYQI